MSSGTLLFLLLLVGAPLAMMLMHRGGHGGHGGMGGGCGMGHSRHDTAGHNQAGHSPVTGSPSETESQANPSEAAHEADGQGHQRHRC